MKIDKYYHLYGKGKELVLEEVQFAQPDRKKGEWLIEPYDTKNDIWVHRCSECLKVAMLGIKTPRYKFCPNCGADMRGEEE